MSEQPKKTIQDNVLVAIEAGKVHMRPKWHFILTTVLYIVGLILIVVASLFIGSFILFMLHQNGAWFAPAFGSEGVRELFTALPIMFIFLAILFVIVLQILVRHYSVSYGKPALYTLGIVLLLVVGGSLLIEQSNFHEGLLAEATEHHLPFAGSLYRHFGGVENPRLTPGIIIEAMEDGFRMEGPRDRLIKVFISSETKIPQRTEFWIGDRVIVLGDVEDDEIEAEGIIKLMPGDRYFAPQRNMGNMMK